LLMAFASISTDIYLPAMPAMSSSLHAPAGSIELTVSGYLVGFCLAQLFWGPLSDRLGRRVPIAIGLLLFIVGSAGCAMSSKVEAMVAWRALQAVGACASVTLARAIVRDLYAGTQAARMMSTLMIVTAIAPLLGPTAGGLILRVAPWRDIFWLLVAVGVITLGLLYTLPETLPIQRRGKETLSGVIQTYGRLLRQPRVLGYAGVGGFLYGGIFVYVAGTPFAYITYYQVPPQYYGMLFALGSIGIMAANLFNVRYVSRFGSDRLMRVGSIAAGLMGVTVAVTSATGWGGLTGLVVPLFLFISCTGLIAANSIAGALNLFPEVAGSVSALIGASQFGSGILGSVLVGLFANGTPFPLGGSMAFFGMGCTLCALRLASCAYDVR
jgi:DHA1 family bicyclomycin/chloramphenicol resistance-like MFS transporter